VLATLFQSFDVHNRQGFVVYNPRIWNNVCLDGGGLFRKLPRFVFGDSFEVSPEVIVQRFFHLDLGHFHQPWGSREWGELNPSPDLSLSTNSDSLCFF
jgi:hypothetical protein